MMDVQRLHISVSTLEYPQYIEKATEKQLQHISHQLNSPAIKSNTLMRLLETTLHSADECKSGQLPRHEIRDIILTINDQIGIPPYVVKRILSVMAMPEQIVITEFIVAFLDHLVVYRTNMELFQADNQVVMPDQLTIKSFVLSNFSREMKSISDDILKCLEQHRATITAKVSGPNFQIKWDELRRILLNK